MGKIEETSNINMCFLIIMYKALNICPFLDNNLSFYVRTQLGQQQVSLLVSSNDDSLAELLIGNRFEEFVVRVSPWQASCCNCLQISHCAPPDFHPMSIYNRHQRCNHLINLYFFQHSSWLLKCYCLQFLDFY